jgi:hypothetical protein
MSKPTTVIIVASVVALTVLSLIGYLIIARNAEANNQTVSEYIQENNPMDSRTKEERSVDVSISSIDSTLKELDGSLKITDFDDPNVD